MSKIPPGRYGAPEGRANARLDLLSSGAPAEFDTLSEVAAELQELQNQITVLQNNAAAIQGGTTEISLLLLE